VSSPTVAVRRLCVGDGASQHRLLEQSAEDKAAAARGALIESKSKFLEVRAGGDRRPQGLWSVVSESTVTGFWHTREAQGSGERGLEQKRPRALDGRATRWRGCSARIPVTAGARRATPPRHAPRGARQCYDLVQSLGDCASSCLAGQPAGRTSPVEG